MRRSFPRTELEQALGARAVHSEHVRSAGYGTNSSHWLVETEDGRRAFVKVALDATAADWLRAEYRVYESVSAPFLPAFLGWHDGGERTLLALEDLSGATWPPPWSPEQIDAVRSALDALHATPPPPGLPAAAETFDRVHGWAAVTADPEPFLSTRLCSRAWLELALPKLSRAAAACDLDGGAFLHLDIRSDNLCFRRGQPVFVDWNLACVGDPLLDLVAWLPSLRLEGGPEPWEVVPDSRGLAAVVAGFFAARAGLPPPATAPTVREFQRRQAEVAVPWAARELGLPPPERA